MDKVKITKEQANGIRVIVADYGSDIAMNCHVGAGQWNSPSTRSLNKLSPSEMARILYVKDSYETEPESEVDLRADKKHLEDQIDELGDYIMKYFHGDIKNGGAVDVAMDIMARLESENKRYREVLENVRQYINKYWDKGYKIQAELYIKQELEGGSYEGN